MNTRALGIVAIVAIATACSTEIPTAIRRGGGGGGGGGPIDESAIAVTPAEPKPGTLVTFDSGTLGDGLRSWDFGDGAADTGIVVSHAFMDEGVYPVRLVFQDGSGPPTEHTFQLVVDDGTREPDRAINQARRRY